MSKSTKKPTATDLALSKVEFENRPPRPGDIPEERIRSFCRDLVWAFKQAQWEEMKAKMPKEITNK